MEKVLVVAVLLLTITWSISRAAVIEGKKKLFTIPSDLKSIAIHSIRFLQTISVDIILKSQYTIN